MNELTKRDGITGKIYLVRGVQVMLDSDLAELYGVPVKRLNEQVKRNVDRFPEEFRFQLTKEESENLRFPNGTSSLRPQSVTLEGQEGLRSQNATLETDRRGQHRKYFPYAFTEQGVAMLSAVLRSQVAVQASIQIMQAFCLSIHAKSRFFANKRDACPTLRSNPWKPRAAAGIRFSNAWKKWFQCLEKSCSKFPTPGIREGRLA